MPELQPDSRHRLLAMSGTGAVHTAFILALLLLGWNISIPDPPDVNPPAVDLLPVPPPEVQELLPLPTPQRLPPEEDERGGEGGGGERPPPPRGQPELMDRTLAPRAPASPPLMTAVAPVPQVTRPVPNSLDSSVPVRSIGAGGSGSGGGSGTGVGNGSGAGTGAGSGSGQGPGNGDGVEADRAAAWVRRPSDETLREIYPLRARYTLKSGMARLSCLVIRGDRPRNCRVVSETPRRLGFGSAAHVAMRTALIRPPYRSGRYRYGERVEVTVEFDIELVR